MLNLDKPTCIFVLNTFQSVKSRVTSEATSLFPTKKVLNLEHFDFGICANSLPENAKMYRYHTSAGQKFRYIKAFFNAHISKKRGRSNEF